MLTVPMTVNLTERAEACGFVVTSIIGAIFLHSTITDCTYDFMNWSQVAQFVAAVEED
jgi:hypothetical protein